MKIINKIYITMLLICALCVSLAGCSSKSQISDNSQAENTSEKTEDSGQESSEVQKAFLARFRDNALSLYNIYNQPNMSEESEDSKEPGEEVALEPAEEASVSSSDGAGATSASTEAVYLNSAWTYADSSVINWGNAVLYKTGTKWNGITVGVNAGHGTSGSTNYQTYCHPDRTAKVTGGTTAAGAVTAVAVSTGMTFNDGTPERTVTLEVAQLLKEKLLNKGYNVLMIRDGEDVQLDNVARTVICNNMADCHIAIHFDGDGLSYDKGAFFLSVPDALKYMDPVSYTWESSEAFGWSVISGLQQAGIGINGNGSMDMDLTQTSYSTVPSIDIELGNETTDHSDWYLDQLANGLFYGINEYFGQ